MLRRDLVVAKQARTKLRNLDRNHAQRQLAREIPLHAARAVEQRSRIEISVPEIWRSRNFTIAAGVRMKPLFDQLVRMDARRDQPAR